MDLGPETHSLFRSRATIASFVIFFLSLALYIPTGAPGLWWGDGPELTAAAYCLGIAHEPGYPLYMLAGHLMIRLLGGLVEPIRAMAIFSALLLAAASALIVPLMVKAGRDLKVSFGIALMMAVSRTVWEHATFAEVYPLTLLMTVMVVILSWREPKSMRQTAILAFALGLASTNHYSILALYPLAGLRILQGVLRSPRRWRATVLAFASYVPQLMIYLYLPIRALADPPLNENSPSSLTALLRFLSARRYAINVDYQLAHMGTRFDGWLEWWGLQWLPASIGHTTALAIGIVLVAAAIAGLVRLASRRPTLGLGLLISIAATLAFALVYRIFDIDAYFLVGLPAALIGWVECGSAITSRVRLPRAAALAPAAIALAAVCFNYREIDLSNDRVPQLYARAILGRIAPGGVLMVGTDSFFPVLYEQIVHHRRPDVAIFPIDWFYSSWHHPYCAGEPPSRIQFKIPRRDHADNLQFTRDIINGVLLPAHRANRQVYCVYFKLSTLEQFFTRRPVASLLPADYLVSDKMKYVAAYPQIDEIMPNPELSAMSTTEVNAAIDKRLGLNRKN